ncbi:MAG: O-antigen polymerase [Clostridiales bacterium]
MFIILQIISLFGVFIVGSEINVDSIPKLLNLIVTASILTLVITPWNKVNNIREIYDDNEQKVRKLTKFLIIISIFTFFVLLATTVLVFSFVDDINKFKYTEGISTDFYYRLPFNVRAFIISTYLYNFSYFLIPLHFYYLGKHKYRLSTVCFILSLNIVLYGLTFFSRAVFVQYLLLYASCIFLFYNTLGRKFKKYIKLSLIVLTIVSSLYFVSITGQRFENDKFYAEKIPAKSLVQNPTLYSYFDYLSQWYNNNMYVLDTYDFSTFSGQLSLQPIQSLLGQYGIIKYDYFSYVKLRQQLLPLNWYTFNGLVADSIYDFGYIFAFILVFVYRYAINKITPKENKISLLNTFYLVLLIQLPLLSIFYSFVSGIVIPLLLIIPISMYLKKNNKSVPDMALSTER